MKNKKNKLVKLEDLELEVLLNHNDGFKIAEIDLSQRGFGSFFQKQQKSSGGRHAELEHGVNKNRRESGIK